MDGKGVKDDSRDDNPYSNDGDNDSEMKMKTLIVRTVTPKRIMKTLMVRTVTPKIMMMMIVRTMTLKMKMKSMIGCLIGGGIQTH